MSFIDGADMTEKQIQEFRAEFFKALVRVTENGGCGLPREVEIEEYRKTAYETDDEFIEDMANGRTPEEAAELYTM